MRIRKKGKKEEAVLFTSTDGRAIELYQWQLEEFQSLAKRDGFNEQEMLEVIFRIAGENCPRCQGGDCAGHA